MSPPQTAQDPLPCQRPPCPSVSPGVGPVPLPLRSPWNSPERGWGGAGSDMDGAFALGRGPSQPPHRQTGWRTPSPVSAAQILGELAIGDVGCVSSPPTKPQLPFHNMGSWHRSGDSHAPPRRSSGSRGSAQTAGGSRPRCPPAPPLPGFRGLSTLRPALPVDSGVQMILKLKQTDEPTTADMSDPEVWDLLGNASLMERRGRTSTVVP